MAKLDGNTLTEYFAAGDTAALRAQAVVDALNTAAGSPMEVTINIRTGGSPDEIVATGTLMVPWATQSGGVITLGEVQSPLTVTQSGSPDPATWYLEFAAGSRYVWGTFGLSSSDAEFKWSLPTFESGQTATLGSVAFSAVSNSAPLFTVAPISASIQAGGGTIQFTAVDPDGDSVSYSLATSRVGISINASSGLVTVTSGAAGTSGNVVIRASDGALYTDTTCAVTVASTSINWHPGHYMQTRRTDGWYTSNMAKSDYTRAFANYPNVKGVLRWFTWGELEGNTRGDVSKGISAVSGELAHLAAMTPPRRLWIGIQEYIWNRTISQVLAAGSFPSYLNTAGYLIEYVTSSKTHTTFNRANTTAAGWYQDFLGALLDGLQSDPNFSLLEGVSPAREILDQGITWSSHAARMAYHAGVGDAIRAAAPTLNVYYPSNLGGMTDDQLISVYYNFRDHYMGTGMPDTIPDGGDGTGPRADRVLRGELGTVPHDFRTDTMMARRTEDSELGLNAVGSVGGYTAQEIYDYCELMGAHYHFWEYNYYTGTDEQRWFTAASYDAGTDIPGGILIVINGQSMTATTYPTTYP